MLARLIRAATRYGSSSSAFRYAAAAPSSFVSSPSSRNEPARKYSSARPRSPPAGGPPEPARRRRRLDHPPLQREDLRGRGIEPEIELELSLARGEERARDAAKRRAQGELVVHLLDGRKVRKREERVRIGAKHRPDDPAFDQIPQMILAKQLVAHQEIAQGVVLPLQRAGRRHAGEAAEPVLVEDLDLRLALRVELLGTLELVALVA